MSLLLFLFYWVAIPSFVIAVAAWLWRRTLQPAARVLIGLASVATVSGLLWMAEGEKWLADRQVREMCAKDGGLRVYERVALPPDSFNQWGQVRIPSERSAGPYDEYFYIASTNHLTNGNPEVWQSRYKVYRKADNKLLGESLGYARRGGGLPGPWQESSFGCPGNTDITALNNRIFSRI